MRKTFYIIGLSIMAFSCTTQNSSRKRSYTPRPTGTAVKTPVKAPAAPKIQNAIKKEGAAEFYTQNIADITKNDNTASYGSIVSAMPKGYKVTRTNFPALAQNFRQKYVILHYTVLPNDKSIEVLTKQSVSSHYLVNDLNDQEIYQLVDENKRAYHAGISAWRTDKNLNDTSIGIEIVNMGYTTDSLGQRVFSPFGEAQFRKVAALTKDIVTRYNIAPTNVLAHSDIAPTRKQDPGPLFPWKRLYDEYQVGMWYEESSKQNLMVISESDVTARYSEPAFILSVQNALQKLGYESDLSGVWDAKTKSTIEALQYHFRPQNYNGILDAETWAILQALNQKYAVK